MLVLGYGDKGTIKTRTVKEERQGFCSHWHSKDGRMVWTGEKKCIERKDSLLHLHSNGPAGQSSPAITFYLPSAKVRGETAELHEGMNVRIHETEREREKEKERKGEREHVWLTWYAGGGGGRWIDR